MTVQKPGPVFEPLPWSRVESGPDDPKYALLSCVRCLAMMLEGYVAGDGESIIGAALCDDCAEDLVSVYLAASPGLALIRRQVFEVPTAPPSPDPESDPGEVHVAIRWSALDGLETSDVQLLSPAVTDPEDEEDLLDQACVRLAEYVNGFHGARVADLPDDASAEVLAQPEGMPGPCCAVSEPYEHDHAEHARQEQAMQRRWEHQ